MAKVIGAISLVGLIDNQAGIEVRCCLVPEGAEVFNTVEFSFSVLTDGTHTKGQLNSMINAKAREDGLFLASQQGQTVIIQDQDLIITALN